MDQGFFCKGKLEKRATRYVHEGGDQVFLFKNVPAEVCTQCGDTFLGPQALRQMEDSGAGKPELEEVTQVPVYSFSGSLP